MEPKLWGILNFDIGVTLREGDLEYFYTALDRHFPGRKEKYQKIYGERYVVTSDQSPRLMKIFYEECRKNDIACDDDEIFRFMRTFIEPSGQMSLF